MWFAFFGCGIDLKTSANQAKIKRIYGRIDSQGDIP